MITINKLDKSFGPVGSSAGIIIFVAGIGSLIWFSWVSMILILIGAFVGFTCSAVEIDREGKRVRFLNMLFGIIKTGQWMDVKPEMKLGVVRSGQTWRSYSGGNRTLDIDVKDFRLVLYDSLGKKLMPVAKAKDINSAKSKLDTIGRQLGIKIISDLKS
jgi:hypothetical protein